MRPIDADALIEFCAERWIPLNIDAVNMQPTIQPEKEQLSCEGTTSDTISRTEVVEHLRRVLDATVPITDYDSGYVDGVEFGVSTVSTMPTVQPQSTTGQLNDSAQSTDLIDRQAALNALMDAVKSVGVLDADDIKTVFDALPSVQHEKAQLSQEGTTSDQPVATDTNVGDAISRQAAIDAVDKYDFNIPEYMEGFVTKLRDAMKEDLREDIAGLPPAQPEPHEGHWIEGKIYRDVIECYCSECGQLMTTAATVRMNYCPNCGAKMKGAQNG